MDLPQKSPRHEELEEWLSELGEDDRFRWLMTELWRSGSPVQRLLSLPKDRLLPRVSKLLRTPVPPFLDFRLPYFPYAAPIAYQAQPPNAVLSQAEEEDVGEEPEEETMDWFGDQELQRLVAHGIVLAIRNNPSLMRCVTSPDYDYHMLLRETKDLTEISLDFLNGTDFLERVQSSPFLRVRPDDTDAALLLKRGVRMALEPFIEDPLFLLRFFGEHLDKAGGVQSFFRDRLTDYLRFLGLPYEVYGEALRMLGEHGLLKNYGAVIVCPGCAETGQPAVLFSFSDLTVGNLGSKCMRCGSATEAAVLYGVDDGLYDLIECPDGIVAPALAWWFDEHSIPWRYSVPLASGECDFVAVTRGQKTAIELKMLDLQGRLVARRIQEGIDQVDVARLTLDAKDAIVMVNAPRDFVASMLGDEEIHRACERWNVSIAPVWDSSETLPSE